MSDAVMRLSPVEGQYGIDRRCERAAEVPVTTECRGSGEVQTDLLACAGEQSTGIAGPVTSGGVAGGEFIDSLLIGSGDEDAARRSIRETSRSTP